MIAQRTAVVRSRLPAFITDLGKGAVNTGKNVGVGAVKGTAKIVKGTGKGIKHIF